MEKIKTGNLHLRSDLEEVVRIKSHISYQGVIIRFCLWLFMKILSAKFLYVFAAPNIINSMNDKQQQKRQRQLNYLKDLSELTQISLEDIKLLIKFHYVVKKNRLPEIEIEFSKEFFDSKNY
jgi:hypothetical protein